MLNSVKEQRVDGSWCGNTLPHLRCTLAGFERNYKVIILSKLIYYTSLFSQHKEKKVNTFQVRNYSNLPSTLNLNPLYISGSTDGFLLLRHYKGIQQFHTQNLNRHPLSLVLWGTNLTSTVGSKYIRAQLAMVCLAPYQHSVIIGLLLSDGWLIFASKTNNNVRLGFLQGGVNRRYFWFVFLSLWHYSSSYPSLRFRTRFGKQNITPSLGVKHMYSTLAKNSIPLYYISMINLTNAYQEKDSVFECGFHSFLGQNRTQFSISFFIFGLLFLLFDLEILLVYPYSVSSYTNYIYGLVVMRMFFVLLTLGFIFEWGKNALTIESRQTSYSNIDLSIAHSYLSGPYSLYDGLSRCTSEDSKEQPLNRLNPYFVSGFIDGEGSFLTIIRKIPKYKYYWQIETRFQMGLHKKYENILELIKIYLGGIGNINKQSKDSVQYSVTSQKDFNVIIDHLNKYPLLTQNKADLFYLKKLLI
jgi:NADH-ubiquinone oxidoreductase chain 3